MVRVLISGLLPHESGKTWVGLTLAKRLIEAGAKVGIYKPVAGHSAWYQYGTVVESLSRGILVGEDIIKYADIVKDVDIEISNPIDILLAPPHIEKYLERNIEEYLNDLENQFKQIVLARVSRCSPRSTKHFVFRENLENTPLYLRESLEQLAVKLKAVDISIENFIENLRTLEIENELTKCLDIIEQGKNITIIESFNNAIAPYARILKYIDIILIVAPSTIIVYEDNTNQILSILTKLINKIGEKSFETINLITNIKPTKILQIKPRLNINENDEVLNSLALKILEMI
jgi:predicted P-loop ATPase/GTPase